MATSFKKLRGTVGPVSTVGTGQCETTASSQWANGGYPGRLFQLALGYMNGAEMAIATRCVCKSWQTKALHLERLWQLRVDKEMPYLGIYSPTGVQDASKRYAEEKKREHNWKTGQFKHYSERVRPDASSAFNRYAMSPGAEWLVLLRGTNRLCVYHFTVSASPVLLQDFSLENDVRIYGIAVSKQYLFWIGWSSSGGLRLFGKRLSDMQTILDLVPAIGDTERIKAIDTCVFIFGRVAVEVIQLGDSACGTSGNGNAHSHAIECKRQTLRTPEFFSTASSYDVDWVHRRAYYISHQDNGRDLLVCVDFSSELIKMYTTKHGCDDGWTNTLSVDALRGALVFKPHRETELWSFSGSWTPQEKTLIMKFDEKNWRVKVAPNGQCAVQWRMGSNKAWILHIPTKTRHEINGWSTRFGSGHVFVSASKVVCVTEYSFLVLSF